MPMREVPEAHRAATVDELWSAIEARLDRLGPALRERLAPGASDADLAALEEALPAGIALPPELRASLRRRAGGVTRTGASGRPYDVMLFDDLGLLSPARIVSSRRWLLSNYRDLAVSPHARIDPQIRRTHYWNEGWIPFAVADEDRALFYCVDCAPSADGVYGQIISAATNDPDRFTEWEGVRAFLAGHVLGQLERPAAEDPDEPGRFRLDGEL